MPVVMETKQVMRAAAGDEGAFSDLVSRYRDAVYGICYHRVGNAEEAKDLAQEVFLRAYLDLKDLRDPAAFPAWLRRVTERVCSTWQRRRRLQVVSLETAPEPVVERDLDLPLAVRQALGQLTENARLTVTLCYIDGYSVEEVARLLEVPAGTVKSRLHHARRRLQGALMDEYKDALRQGAPGDEFAGAVVRAVRSLEEAKTLPGAQYVHAESQQDLERYLVLEKDGTVLGVSYYGEGRLYLRGLTVRAASCDVTSGENDWHKGGLGIYDRLKAASLANLAELGYPLAATHEEVMSAPRHGYVPCFYHFRITAPAESFLPGEPTGMIRPYRDADQERLDFLRTLLRPEFGAGSWDPGELPPFVLERDGAVVGYCAVLVKHRHVPPWCVNEMVATDLAAYRDLIRQVAEMARAEGDDTISTHHSPQHPLGALLLARGGLCEMKGASWDLAKHEEFVCILDLTGALRAVAPGLGRGGKGRVSIDMDGDTATITAGDPPAVVEGAKGTVSRIGRIPMTQLLAGYHSVFEIASRPDVAIRDEDRSLLDALFPKDWPYSQPDPYLWNDDAVLEAKPFIAEEPWRSGLAAQPRPWAV